MKILFVSEDHSTVNYGVTTMLSQLADQLVCRHAGLQLVIAATGSTAVPQEERVRIELIPPAWWAFPWRWSPGLTQRLAELIACCRPDLIHIHGVWSAGPWTALRLARQMQIPAILSVHGMWGAWFWEKDNRLRILKKRLYFESMLRRAISPQVTIHALNPIEEQNISRLLPHNPAAVVPNAIHMDGHQPGAEAPEKMILFLGRLHPIKGVELLVRAFAQSGLASCWQLVIAGPESTPSYARMLKSEVLKSGLQNQVMFLGPVFGAAKEQLIRKAWVQVLPSFSEGQAMINLETATYGVPSITTFQAGLCDWEEGGGLLIEPDAGQLAEKLEQACAWSVAERNRRGAGLHDWVVKNYSFEATMPQWEKLYTAITGREIC